TFGVAAFGTIFFTRPTSQLMERIGPAVKHLDLNRLVNSPSGSTHVPAAIANDLRLSLSSALHDVFVGTMFVAIIALVLAFLLKEKPLRTTSNVSAALSPDVGPVAEAGAREAA